MDNYMLVRGDKPLTISLVGARMRNYAAAEPITVDNPSGSIQAVACFGKDEKPYQL